MYNKYVTSSFKSRRMNCSREDKRIILGYDEINFCGTKLELDLYTNVESNSSSLHKGYTITIQVSVPSSSDVNLLWDLLQHGWNECYQIELDNRFKGLFNKCYLVQLPYCTGSDLVLDFNAYKLEDNANYNK